MREKVVSSKLVDFRYNADSKIALIKRRDFDQYVWKMSSTRVQCISIRSQKTGVVTVWIKHPFSDTFRPSWGSLDLNPNLVGWVLQIDED